MREDVVLATIYNTALDGYVYIYQDGRIKLEAQDRTLELDLGAEAQGEWWQYHYICDLLKRGLDDKELLEAIKAVREAEEEMQSEDWEEGLEQDFDYAQERFRQWCQEEGLDYEQLTEEERMSLVNKAVHEWRKSKR